MRFWTAYAFIALSVVAKAYGSDGGHGGEHHAPSITSLIAPCINVVILFGVLIYVTKDKLKGYFVSKSEEVSNTLDRASIKSKEAQLMLDTQKRKMAALDSEIKNINQQTETDVLTYEKKLSKEVEDKIAKLKVDAASKVQADKKQMMNDLNAELLEQVIAKTKSTIKGNKDFQGKVSSKMLQGLQ
jgi:F0F1-type ATP synthase membrane subunit b/b'